MKKELKDFLPLYLGCEMQYSSHHEPQDEKYILTVSNLKEAIEFGDLMVLRSLNDITIEEVIELQNWLRQHFFDCDDLIEKGIAVSKK